MKMYLPKYIKLLENLLNMNDFSTLLYHNNITFRIGIHGKTLYNSTIDKI